MNKCEYESKRILTLTVGEDRPVILFGAAANGDITSFYAKSLGMNVVGFCDNSDEKIGAERCGLRVHSLTEALNMFDKPVFIVCSYKSADEITVQLNEQGMTDVFLWYVICYLYITQKTKRPINIEKFAQAAFSDGKDTLRFSSTAFKITSHCNLNCLNCAELIPYNKYPVHYEKNQLLLWLERLMESVDVLEHLSINGGEPFMHPDLVDIIKGAGKFSNILNIGIVTNGTVMPKPKIFDVIAENGVIIQTSYYNNLSAKIPDIKSECDKRGIPCFISDISLKWTKMQTTENFNRTKEQNIDKHLNCGQRKINQSGRISRGEFHYCSLSEARVDLEMIPRDDELHIDLTSDYINAVERRDKILHLKKKKTLTYCGFCASFYEMVPPAEQASGKMKYKKYYER